MIELINILNEHAIKYPLMEPCDAVKLIYQNEFGGGHLISDGSASLSRLKKEYQSIIQSADIPLFESIGNGIVRVNLAAMAANGLTIKKLNDIFIDSSGIIQGTKESFINKLSVLSKLTENSLFSFKKLSLHTYMNKYMSEGYPPVSHSERYKDAYNPAYRVIIQNLFIL